MINFWITLNPNSTINGPFSDEPESGGRLLTANEKSLCDSRSSFSDIIINDGETLRMATFEEIPRFLPIDTAILFIVGQITNSAKQAKFLRTKLTLKAAYEAGEPLEVIRLVIEDFDTAGDSVLEDAKSKILSLPQWSA